MCIRDRVCSFRIAFHRLILQFVFLRPVFIHVEGLCLQHGMCTLHEDVYKRQVYIDALQKVLDSETLAADVLHLALVLLMD